jgi:hypothetical protein
MVVPMLLYLTLAPTAANIPPDYRPWFHAAWSTSIAKQLTRSEALVGGSLMHYDLALARIEKQKACMLFTTQASQPLMCCGVTYARHCNLHLPSLHVRIREEEQGYLAARLNMKLVIGL